MWGFPGIKDRVDFRNADQAAKGKAPYTDPGWNDTYEASAYLNLGIEFKPTNNCTINLVGNNLLGLLAEDLNKVNYIGGFGGHRIQAPSVGLSVKWSF